MVRSFEANRIHFECQLVISAEIRTTSTESTTITEKETEGSTVIVTENPECNPATPNKAHEEDCHKFYTCTNGANGAEYIEQTCGSYMMYNPNTLTCDSIDAVSSIRPECGKCLQKG